MRSADEIRAESLPLIAALQADDDAMGTSNAVALMNLIAEVVTERDSLRVSLARRDAAIQAVRDMCDRALADVKRPVAELRADGRHLPAVPAMALMAAHVRDAITAALDATPEAVQS